MTPRPSPRSADLLSPTELEIVWKDGTRHRFAARALRLACPCAGCVDEGSGVRTLDPATVAPTISILQVQPVGRYALAPTFSDTHRTGVFPWDYLYHLGNGGAPKGTERRGS